KCEQLIADPFSSYCAGCGVPLKRILPRTERREPLLVICSNPECSGAVTTAVIATLPSRCPRCHSPLISHCWKCGARVVEAEQHYCQMCGVPLKPLSSVVSRWIVAQYAPQTPPSGPGASQDLHAGYLAPSCPSATLY